MAEEAKEEVAGEDTQHLNAIFGSIQGYRKEIADLKQLLAKSKEESAWLRNELLKYQRGEYFVVEIEGKKFQLVPESAQVVTLNDDFLNAGPKQPVLTDTLSVFKD